MNRRLLLFCLFALVPALIASACGDAIRPPAAQVNGNAISEDALDAELSAIAGNSEYVETIEQGGTSVLGNKCGPDTGKPCPKTKLAGVLDLTFVGRVLTRQIFLQLVHAEVLKRDLVPTDAEIKNAREEVVRSVGGAAIFDKFPTTYQTTLLRRSAEVAKLQADLSDVKITDESIKKFYDENQALFAQTCVSHILLAVAGPNGLDQAATETQSDRLKAEADAAKARIDGGADFAVVAKEVSADSTNKDSGGNLECGPPGRFVPEFEIAMDELQPNQVSAPVKTQFGWHLIKVTERKPQSLEEAEPQIRERLQADSQEGFSEFLEEALGKAKITVNPRYGRFSKEGQSPGIVPPNAPTTTEAGVAPPPAGGAPNPFGP